MSRFDTAMARIDAVHAEDPEKDAAGQPKELAYAQRMSAWLAKLAPAASEPLQLAVRCQHLRRWAIPRTSYPEGKVGYLRWRKDESLAHAALAGSLGACSCVLMCGHGMTVVGESVPEAVYRAIHTEMNARLQLQATLLEGPIAFLSDEGGRRATATNRGTHERPWQLWKKDALRRK